ncbi:MAG: hypothetical protein K8S98_15995 [Planctomycetes bacterium]|nr:hypothetical protein [Planctomycetota bacterium]
MFLQAFLVAASTVHVAQEPRSIDQLIDALPPVGCETHFDESGKVLTSDPASVELKELVANHALTDDQWRRALRTSGAIRWSPRWVAEDPFLVRLRIPEWVGGGRLTLTPRNDGMVPAEDGSLDPQFGCGPCDPRGAMSRFWWSGHELGPLPAGTRSVMCDVRIERTSKPSARGRSGKVSTVWQGSIDLEVELAGSIDAVLPAVSGPAIDQSVRDALELVVEAIEIDYGELVPDIELKLRLDADHQSKLLETALSLEVELMRDAEVVGEKTWAIAVELSGLGHGPHPGAAAPTGYALTCEVPPIPAEASRTPEERSRWRLRVRGIGRGALAVWNAKRYWKGEISILLADALAAFEADRAKH